MTPVLSLTTDFGLKDGYVGTMHAVILSICPAARIVDLSHEITPHDVREAAFVLYKAYPFFPSGTVHVVVVDPGVGSERRAIAVQTRHAYFVAPDNGVLSYVLAREHPLKQVQLTNRAFWLSPLSHTFHGRDIFCPVAAHLAQGVSLDQVGTPIERLTLFPMPEPEQRADGSLLGHVLYVDRFGNLITDVRAEALAGHDRVRVAIAGRRIEGLSATYADVGAGELVALIGSEGHLEIARREGSAAETLSAHIGTELLVERDSS